jgi:hypothetical protein
MISQAFHEIYDEPLQENELDDIFTPKTYSEFKTSSLDYNSNEIYTYIEHFLGCLRQSFVNPISYNTEFTYLVNHDLTSTSNKSTQNSPETLNQNTPLIQINNMFQKFSFLHNLFRINQEFNEDENEIGMKRKLQSKLNIIILHRS